MHGRSNGAALIPVEQPISLAPCRPLGQPLKAGVQRLSVKPLVHDAVELLHLRVNCKTCAT